MAEGCGEQVRQQRMQAQPAKCASSWLRAQPGLRTRFAREPQNERRCQAAALPMTAMAGRNDYHHTKAGQTETFPASEFDHGTALKG